MIITKQQSKRLRYICGTVDYNQPCVKKYTGGPEGKIRQIGKFKYIERGNELVYFEYDGDVTPLSNYEAEEFLSALMDDSGFHLGGCIHVEDLPSADTNNHNDIVDAVAGAVEHQVQIDVQPKNEVHEVNVPVEVQPATDDWMDDNGNDPDSIDQGTADIPELLTEEEKKAAEEDNLPPAIDTSTEVPPVKLTERAYTKEDAEKAIEDVKGQPLTGAPPTKTPKELTDDVIREIAMTAAAREAATDYGIVGIPDTATSVDIVRTCYTTPGFMNIYGECLMRVGNPRSLEEIAEALPAQRKWLFK